jgi:hypothetical protein
MRGDQLVLHHRAISRAAIQDCRSRRRFGAFARIPCWMDARTSGMSRACTKLLTRRIQMAYRAEAAACLSARSNTARAARRLYKACGGNISVKNKQ